MRVSSTGVCARHAKTSERLKQFQCWLNEGKSEPGSSNIAHKTVACLGRYRETCAVDNLTRVVGVLDDRPAPLVLHLQCSVPANTRCTRMLDKHTFISDELRTRKR